MAAQLADRLEIEDTVKKFCWCIDAKKPLSAHPGCMEEVFTADFQFGLSRESVQSADEITLSPMGLAAFSAFIEKVQGKYVATQHHCTNTIVTFTSAETANAKTYATNYHVKKEEHGGGHYDYYGVYDDELVKTASGWRIKARKQYPFFAEGTTAPDPK
jgi:hypothetical protein